MPTRKEHGHTFSSALTDILKFHEFPKRGNVPEAFRVRPMPFDPVSVFLSRLFTFSCRDGSHAGLAYNQHLERSEAIECLERFERPQVYRSRPFASHLLSCIVFLAYLIKTGFRICPINDDLLPIGP